MNTVLIMIMLLSFTQIVKPDQGSIPCPILCAVQCMGLNFKTCFIACLAKCPAMSPNTYNCVNNCGVNKTITVNKGIYSLMTLIFVYCFYGL